MDNNGLYLIIEGDNLYLITGGEVQDLYLMTRERQIFCICYQERQRIYIRYQGHIKGLP